MATTATYVYDFSQGSKDQKDLLGGKGANLAEMTNLGLPVPPGFTISTEACRAYLLEGREPDGLADQVTGPPASCASMNSTPRARLSVGAMRCRSGPVSGKSSSVLSTPMWRGRTRSWRRS